MAASTVRVFHIGVETVGVSVIEVMDAAGRIVAPMTINTVIFLVVTGLTPLGLFSRLLCVLVLPADRVNVEQVRAGAVAEPAVVVSPDTVVTAHAQ